MRKKVSPVTILSIIFLFLLGGCSAEEKEPSNPTPSQNGSIVVRLDIPQGAASIQDIVTNIVLTAKWLSKNKTVNCNQSSPTSPWKGVITDLPSNMPITLTASAKNIFGEEIYSNEKLLAITPGQRLFVNLFIQAVSGKQKQIPVVTSVIWSAEKIHVNHSADMSVTVEDEDGGEVTYNLTSKLSGSFFDFPSGTVHPAPGIPDTFGVVYTAGDIPGEESIKIELIDDTGKRSKFSTSIVIDSNADIDGTVNFPPDILSIDHEVFGDVTLFTATVSDDQDTAGIEYEWYVDGVFAGATNPVTVNTPHTGATIHVTVTDAFNAARSYSVIW